MERALRRVVRHILEAAMSSGQAASQNLALLRKNNGDSVVYVLYDPFKLAAAMDDDNLSDLRRSSRFASLETMIYGYLDVKPHHGDAWNAGEVKYAAAESGYGPLMYELAMSDFKTLMSDRLSTSDAAKNVWKKYAARSDVETKPLDNKDEPKTPPKVDDAYLIPDYYDETPYLNAAYSGVGDGGSKPALMANHRDCAATIADQLQSSSTAVEQKIMHMGDQYFGIRYMGDV